MDTFAVIGFELAGRLLSKGFDLIEVKQGKYSKIYYFADSDELYLEITKYLDEEQKIDSVSKEKIIDNVFALKNAKSISCA